MAHTIPRIAFIGFGEAAQAFVEGFQPAPPGSLTGYDRKTDFAPTKAAKLAEFESRQLRPALSLADALDGATHVFSVVTADQSLAAAREAATHIAPDTFYFDMNSVAPDTKRAAAALLAPTGANYVDVAVMAPVRPVLLAVPMLVSAENCDSAVAALTSLGFKAARIAGDIGRAASIKMIRSIMVKGMEALTAECLLCARAAGVEAEVLGSLQASDPALQWATRADYNFERMMRHGSRRAAEMAEAAKTADDLGLGGAMARATTQWQARIGALDLAPTPTLAAKGAKILNALRSHA
jgi:3-hydroxyisobutyrate dehydrogenase-like beta-hydroxyacid dehydrogenase